MPEEMRRLAFFDPAEFWNADGTLKSVRDVAPEHPSVLMGFEVIIKNRRSRGRHPTQFTRLSSGDKLKASRCWRSTSSGVVDDLQMRRCACLFADVRPITES